MQLSDGAVPPIETSRLHNIYNTVYKQYLYLIIYTYTARGDASRARYTLFLKILFYCIGNFKQLVYYHIHLCRRYI